MRTAFQSMAAIVGILLVFVYAIGAELWTNTGDNWYRGLNSPSWQPPDFIFGLIWPYNFIVLGFAAVTVANKLSDIKIIIYLVIFLISVIFAVMPYQIWVIIASLLSAKYAKLN
jgi:tryptophan-rich sensory protein